MKGDVRTDSDPGRGERLAGIQDVKDLERWVKSRRRSLECLGSYYFSRNGKRVTER